VCKVEEENNITTIALLNRVHEVAGSGMSTKAEPKASFLVQIPIHPSQTGKEMDKKEELKVAVESRQEAFGH